MSIRSEFPPVEVARSTLYRWKNQEREPCNLAIERTKRVTRLDHRLLKPNQETIEDLTKILGDRNLTPEFITELVNCLGLTCEEFGESIGVSRKQVIRWRTGKYIPSPLAILNIAETYTRNVLELLELYIIDK